MLDARGERNSAAPLLRFDAHVSEESGHEVFTIALSVQIMFEPAKRSYDAETKERLVEMFGAPERWPQTTNNFLWAEVDVLLPAFTGATGFRIPLACTFDMEIAAAKYLYSLPDGLVPLLFNFTGSVFYRGEDGRIQVAKVPWDRSARYELPVQTWRDLMAAHYPNGSWVRLGDETMEALAARKAAEGAAHLRHGRGPAAGGRAREPRSTSWSSRCCTRATRSTRTRPTPPRTRRRRRSGSSTRPGTPKGSPRRTTTCAWTARWWPTPASRRARTVRFLQSQGERHRAHRAADRDPRPGRGDPVRLRRPDGPRADAPGPDAARPPARARVRAQRDADGQTPTWTAPRRCASALLSTHVVVTAPGGRFVSPLETPELQSVNTFPVLATEADDTVVGAAIVLPDHPQISPHSRGNLFDGTEIEEALLLHVHTLSDGEREAIAEQDPQVREMVERAAATTGQDVMALHGVMRPSEQLTPPEPPARLPALTGDEQITVGENTFVKGGKVKLNPGDGGDPYDLMVRGRTATIERILHDVDGRLYFAVTVDGDPGQDLLRDTNRFLYFFSEEILPT